MAEKFPSLEEAKQRVFSIDIARFAVEKDERAALVTAERSQITLFWSRADGTWSALGRTHDALNLTPRRPERSADFGWTSRIGVGTQGSQIALVYKRRFAASSAGNLWIDVFEFDPTADAFVGTTAPRRFPREAFEIAQFGFNIWADGADRQLSIVAQAFLGDNVPRLVLLQTAFPVDDPVRLEDPQTWRYTELDRGGWDFAARREGERLAVLHRREAPTYSTDLFLPIDPGFGGPVRVLDVRLSENPNIASRTLTDMAVSNLVLVEVNLASTAVTTIDDTLPFGENPQVHSLTPFIATIDRLNTGGVRIRSGGAVELSHFRSNRHLLMKTSAGWHTTTLLHSKTPWPRYLNGFARAHLGISLELVPNVRAFRLMWRSLWTLRQIVLLSREETLKGTLLTFAHQDSDLGALRATTFQVFEDDGGNHLRAIPQSFTLLDLGHRHIREPRSNERDPIEYRQLDPLAVDSRADDADGLAIARFEESGNTLAGAIAAPNDRPESFYAYTDMGDGGVRVIFDGDLTLPAPTAIADEKTFKVGWVAEPVRLGRAWVRLANAVFDSSVGPVAIPTPARLPGYFNPVSLLNRGSIVFEQQGALDALAVVVSQLRADNPRPDDLHTFNLTPGGEVRYREPPGGRSPETIEFIGLGEDTADLVQDFVLHPDIPPPPPRARRSASDQPFAIFIQPLQVIPFANETLAFDGIVDGGVNQDDFQFDWTFSDGTTDTGRHIEHNFDATQPDFSRPNAGPVLGNIEITLTVTAPDATTSTVSLTFPLAASLWATLWTAYGSLRRAPDNILDDGGDWQVSAEEWESYLSPGMFIRDATLSFYRYSIRYLVDEQGRGTRVEISNRTEHDDRFLLDNRFLFLGNATGQGDVAYEVPIRAQLAAVRLTGDFGGGLGNLVQIDTVDVRMTVTQRFTVGVQTSEQRETFTDTETILRRDLQGLLGPIVTRMTPSALCALPVEQAELDIKRVDVTTSLTAAGFGVAALIPAVIAAVGLGALLLVVAIFAPWALPAFLAGSLSAGVLIITAAGLGLLIALLINFFILRGFIADRIREPLEKRETLISLREAGLFTYAGEGLCEALTQHFITQAQQADGLNVADPGTAGRDRYRSPFFETIVVGQNECKAELRV